MSPDHRDTLLAVAARSPTAFKIALLAAFAAAWHAAPWLPSPWLRMLAALAAFAVPGLALQRLILGTEAGGFARQVTLGFTASLALTGIFGLPASFLRMPYVLVTEGLFVAGVLLGVLAWRASPVPTRPRPGRQAALDAVLLLLVGLMAARLCLAPMLGADDFSHLARVRSFQQEPALSFEDFVFGGHPAPPRYWLSFWPLAQAVASTVSGLDPFESLAIYQAPLLALLAVLATLTLARALGLREPLALLAVPAQLVALLLTSGRFQAGSVFFNRLAEDKVLAAFVIAPVVLRQLADALERPSRRMLLALAVAGLALLFTHPTVLGATCAIAALHIGLDVIVRRRWRPALAALAILVLLPAVPASFRFLATASEAHDFTLAEAAEADRLDGPRAARLRFQPGSDFYAVSESLWAEPAFAILPLAAVASLFGLRRSAAARYVLASSLVVGSVAHPATARLLGMALTPFHLWRVLWLAPFGIGLAVIVETLARWPRLRALAKSRVPAWAVGILFLLLPVGWPAGRIGALESWPAPPGWAGNVYDTLRSVGRPAGSFDEMRDLSRLLGDTLQERAVVVSEEPLNSFLPGLCVRARPLFFRSFDQTMLHGQLDLVSAQKRHADWADLTSAREPPQERFLLLDRNAVRYLVATGQPAWMTSLLRADPGRFREAGRAGAFTLYEVLPPSS